MFRVMGMLLVFFQKQKVTSEIIYFNITHFIPTLVNFVLVL